MRRAERSRDGQTVVKQRAPRFARQAPGQRRENNESYFKEKRQTYQKRRHQDGPARSLPSKLVEHEISYGAAAARMLDQAADHGPQADHDRDETQSLAEAGLHGFQYRQW